MPSASAVGMLKGESEMEQFPFTSLSRTRLGRYEIELAELDTPQGRSPYSIVHMRPFACCLAVVNHKLALVRQYRYAVDSWQLELPAGGVELGESPEAAALRELTEETGLVPSASFYLGMAYPSAGSTDEECHMVVALCDGSRTERQLDVGEQTELVMLSRSEVEQLLDSGSFAYMPLYVMWLKLERMGLLDCLFDCAESIDLATQRLKALVDRWRASSQ